MAWITDDPMVGQRVTIYTAWDNEETATVLAVSNRNASIRVRADEDGEILVGNQWEPLD